MASGDVFTGTPGNDFMFVGTGETARAGDGDDHITGSGVGGVADGGTGNDTFRPNPNFGPIITDLRFGTSTLITPIADPLVGPLYSVSLVSIENVLAAGQDGEIIIGNDEANVLVGAAGAQFISGEGGNDTLRPGGFDNDTLDGGSGIDTIDLINQAGVNISLVGSATQYNQVAFGNGNSLSFRNFENVRGSQFDDIIVGDTNANKIEGGRGNDMLSGGGGADTFVFVGLRLGQDTITDFSLADDRLDIKSDTVAPDVLTSRIEAAGDTTLFFEGGSVTIKGIVGLSLAQWRTYVVNSGFSVPNLGLDPLNVVGTSASNTLSGTQRGENLIGLAGNDVFYGSAGIDGISGGFGSDELRFDFYRAGTGLSSTLGNRNITVAASGVTDSAGQVDTVFSGIERVSFETNNQGEVFSTGTTTIDASAFTGNQGVSISYARSTASLIFVGSAASDSVAVGRASHFLDGGGGLDSLQLLYRSDAATTVTQSGTTIRVVSDGNVTEVVNFEKIQLVPNFGFSTGSTDASGVSIALEFSVSYGTGSQSFVGGSGNDLFRNSFSGGANLIGTTTMTGGAGADTYYYTGFGTNFDKDVVTDFTAEDRIDLSPVALFNSANPARFIGSGVFTKIVNQVRYEKSGTTTLLQVDGNGDGVADATLTLSNGAFDIRETAPGSGVLAINQVPVITSNGGGSTATISLSENTTAVSKVQAIDLDAGSSLIYSISGGTDSNRFQINALTGMLSFIVAPNFEGPVDTGADNVYEVTVRASDGILTDDQALAITVTNANEAPVVTSGTTASFAENGTGIVYQIVATDPDSGTTFLYSLTGADASLFAIDSATGALRFVAEPNFELPLDAGANNVYDVVVSASDGGLSAQQAIAVTVTDVDEVPTQTYAGTTLADTFMVSDGNGWTMSGLAGNDTLTGGGKADVLIGGRNNDVLVGGGGDDIFRFAAGDGIDSYDGGIGFDQIVATSANAAIAISAISGIEAIRSGGFAGVSIIGTTAADTLDFSGTVLTGITRIDAGAGNDVVTGSAGADTIVLGSGNDVFDAGDGDDIFLASGSIGIDTINGGAGFDTILANATNATINAAALTAIEAISGNGFAGVSIVGTTGNDVMNFSAIALTGIERIDPGAGNDTVTGTANADTIVLGSGNDVLNGGNGNDIFVAKAGAGLDTIDGGAGHDVVVAAAANVSITLAGFTSIEEFSANGFAGVKLLGSTLADVIDYSGVTLTGIDSILGGAGNDRITGSSGDDRMFGGTGVDILTGGLGADTFAFSTTAESGFGATRADHITDFLSGTDIIDLTAIDADASVAGNQDFVFIGDAAFTGLGQLRIGLDADGHIALFGNTTGSLTADFQISFDNNALLLPADIHL